MNRSPDTELIISLAHKVVTQIAPGELLLFPSISADYAAIPNRILKHRDARDKGLGLGSGELIPLLTADILLIVQQALAQIGADTIEKGADTFFHRLRKKIFNRSSSSKSKHDLIITDFSAEQLYIIQNYIYKAAIQRKFTEANAKQFASIVVGQLAVRKAEEKNSDE